MIELKEIESNIFQFEIIEEYTKTDAESMYKWIQEKAAKEEKFKMIAIVKDFPKFKNFFSLIKPTAKLKIDAIRHISRYAVLSDRDWVEAIMPISNLLTPGIPIKHFDLDEKDEAIKWLKEDGFDYTEEEYFSKMNIEHIRGTSIYSFTIDDEVDESGINTLRKIIEEKAKDKKIRLIATIKDFPSFQSFKTFIVGLILDFEAIGKIDRYAIVSNEKWVEKSVKFGDFVTPGLEMKLFSTKEKDIAIEWLKE